MLALAMANPPSTWLRLCCSDLVRQWPSRQAALRRWKAHATVILQALGQNHDSGHDSRAYLNQYDHHVETYRIEPPIGGKIGWGARAKVKRSGTRRDAFVITLSEHFGATEDEARERADAEAKQWIAERSRLLPQVDTDLY